MFRLVVLLLAVLVPSALCEFYRCGSVLRESGILSSHQGYGQQNYAKGSSCYWYINPPAGYSVAIQTNAFQLAPKSHGHCSDKLSFNNQVSSGAWSGYTYFCGNQGPNNLVFNDVSYLHVAFDGTKVGNYRGFEIKVLLYKPGTSVTTKRPTTTRPTTAPTTTRKPTAPPSASKCGVQAIKPILGHNGDGFRVVGGMKARRGSWPWAAGLVQHGYQGCGATLIHPQWVVSAAHCFSSSSTFGVEIELGKHAKYDMKAQKIKVSKLFIHERYNTPISHDNDIALLKLERPAYLSDGVTPVCLPTAEVRDQQQCYTMGWGRTHGTSHHGNLKQAMLPALTSQSCKRYFGSQISDNMICAGFKQGGHDSCQGDSGGPFVCNVNGKWELSGVVSWGYGCAQRNSPGVYTKVKNYNSWINNIMDNN